MSLDDRRNDFENRYAHDLELRFRVEARRNRLVALWAAEKLGMSGADADAYAQGIVSAGFGRDGEKAIEEKIRADFEKGGVSQSDHRIHRHMSELLIEAEKQVVGE